MRNYLLILFFLIVTISAYSQIKVCLDTLHVSGIDDMRTHRPPKYLNPGAIYFSSTSIDFSVSFINEGDTATNLNFDDCQFGYVCYINKKSSCHPLRFLVYKPFTEITVQPGDTVAVKFDLQNLLNHFFYKVSPLDYLSEICPSTHFYAFLPNQELIISDIYKCFNAQRYSSNNQPITLKKFIQEIRERRKKGEEVNYHINFTRKSTTIIRIFYRKLHKNAKLYSQYPIPEIKYIPNWEIYY